MVSWKNIGPLFGGTLSYKGTYITPKSMHKIVGST